jgi:hypothetical protein
MFAKKAENLKRAMMTLSAVIISAKIRESTKHWNKLKIGKNMIQKCWRFLVFERLKSSVLKSTQMTCFQKPDNIDIER